MDTEPFATIEYTPAWYYKHFPGFYNVECYNILADYSSNPEKYTSVVQEGVEEQKNDTCIKEESTDDEHVNKKVKISIET